jgi:SAM-dependent methyltransferase
MRNHPVYGISAPEKGWVPAPRYLLRRHRVLELLDPLARGRLLEIGCGAGALLHDLSRMGFLAEAVEISPAAQCLAWYINRDNPHVTIHHAIQNNWDKKFDYVLAFEVLEHIKDDIGALKQWSCWLKPGGYLLLSVPAHPKRWNATDEWAGHLRRYERAGLREILEQAGFIIVHMEVYGFPLAAILEPIRAQYHGKQLKRNVLGRSGGDQHPFTERSGVDRALEKRLYPLQAHWVGTKIMQLFCALQGIFSNTEWGNGLLALCTKI